MSDKPLGDIQGDHIQVTKIAAVASSAPTREDVLFTAPFECTVTAVHVIPVATVAGVDTNTRALNILNKGAGGSGTSQIGDLSLTSGIDLTGGIKNAIDAALSHNLNAGEVLTLQLQEIATGRSLPEMLAVVTFRGQL